MRRPVCYDVTRLLTRILNATPNGIDRVDHVLARHFLAGDPATTFAATATGFGSRLIKGPAAADAVDAIAAHWGESGRDVDGDPVYSRVLAWLSGETTTPAPRTRRRLLPRIDIRGIDLGGIDLGGIVDWTRRHGLPVTTTSNAGLPPHSLYVNSSQFPLWVASSFEWLEARPDIRAAFFIHDLLPILMPEYFRAAEFERHQARMRNFARFATAAIVTTQTVAADLAAHMALLGRTDVPMFVAQTPISPTFSTLRIAEPALRDRPFFVFCSTIEPRKNHLMILAVWRALVGRLGKTAPKLVLVGTRGWHYDAIVDLIERSPGLRDHVIEIGGLSTPGLKRLIDNARAVLMPTFGEGYGLPVHEALAAGAPVVASDIPVFREIPAAGLTLLSPLAGEAWLETIAALSVKERMDSTAAEPATPAGWSDYFGALDAFADAL